MFHSSQDATEGPHMLGKFFTTALSPALKDNFLSIIFHFKAHPQVGLFWPGKNTQTFKSTAPLSLEAAFDSTTEKDEGL